MVYNVFLFLHIFGVILMFAGVSLVLTAVAAMSRTNQIEAIRLWAGLAVKSDKVLPVSVLFILLPGIYLTSVSWGWNIAWVNVSLITLISMTLTGPLVNLPRLKAIAKEADKPVLTPLLSSKIKDRTLWISLSTMTFLTVAILFLMTMKFGLIGSLSTILFALFIGAFTGLFAANKLHFFTEEKPATSTDAY
ncbi:hypothetical protein [Thalassobacillus pellis]|uniref:hypothetical protein n=1 Tax=Thalassobacillus pellis TaxID=748008 RepID=UPI00196017CA|nr:hypothetical protein [Thalassobacillus pellis]MBM7553359.1 hypothetical protein [Thalassobacillus pellis]